MFEGLSGWTVDDVIETFFTSDEIQKKKKGKRIRPYHQRHKLLCVALHILPTYEYINMIYAGPAEFAACTTAAFTEGEEDLTWQLLHVVYDLLCLNMHYNK